MEPINIGLDNSALQFGTSLPIGWDCTRYPHMVIFGATGSGKTYLLKLILGRISLHIPDSHMTICDFKGGDDFSFLDGCISFYRFTAVQDGLYGFHDLLKRRQTGEDKTRHCFLIIDEYASFLNSLDKKQAEASKQALASVLMLGRSFNQHIIISQQRLDAVYFSNARDNFSAIIGMGKLSRESADMMFSDYKDMLDRNKPRGEGSCLLGNEFYDIVVPRIRDMPRLESIIRQSVLRSPPSGAKP